MTSTSTAVLAGVGLLIAAAPALAWEPSAEAQKVLARGQPWSEVLPDGRGAGLIHAAIDIPAAPGSVWTAMTHCGPSSRFVSSLKSCRVLSGDQRAGSDVRERISHGGLLTPPIRDVVETRYDAPHWIRFHRVAGDLRTEVGETRLEPLDGGAATRVICETRVAVASGFPDGLVRAAMRLATPSALLNLRRNALAAAEPRQAAASTDLLK